MDELPRCGHEQRGLGRLLRVAADQQALELEQAVGDSNEESRTHGLFTVKLFQAVERNPSASFLQIAQEILRSPRRVVSCYACVCGLSSGPLGQRFDQEIELAVDGVPPIRRHTGDRGRHVARGGRARSCRSGHRLYRARMSGPRDSRTCARPVYSRAQLSPSLP
jgi:hypothetical protein